MSIININLGNHLPNVPKIAQEVGKLRNYSISAGKISEVSPLLTKYINTGTALFMRLGNEEKKISAMYHIAPECTPLNILKNLLSRELEKIYNKNVSFNDDFDVVIYGGRELDIAPDSFSLYDEIIKACDKLAEELNLKTRMSIICGKKEKVDFDEMYTFKDNITLSNANMLQNIESIENFSRQDLIKALENKYQIVEINDEHKLNLIK